MWRVLKAGGQLLLSFHIGDEIVHPDEFLGQPNSMDFFFFQPQHVQSGHEDHGHS